SILSLSLLSSLARPKVTFLQLNRPDTILCGPNPKLNANNCDKWTDEHGNLVESGAIIRNGTLFIEKLSKADAGKYYLSMTTIVM
ncbi:hypothetical protein PENTCL1PPCAC_15946, partial [Pristionchus entomophagus]